MRQILSAFSKGLNEAAVYSTFDVTNTDLKNELGSYMTAMRAFAECAERNMEAPGAYCHPRQSRDLHAHAVPWRQATATVPSSPRRPCATATSARCVLPSPPEP